MIFTIIGLGKQRFVKNLYLEFHENPKDGLVIDRQADRMTDPCDPHTRHSFSSRKERVNRKWTIRASILGSDRSYFFFNFRFSLCIIIVNHFYYPTNALNYTKLRD